MSFQELIEKGKKAKEIGKTKQAMDLYRQAFDLTETDNDKKDVWTLVLHIHTDKMLATLIEIAEVYNTTVSELMSESGKSFNWIFGTNNFKPGSNDTNIKGYVRPNKNDLFR